jgi:PAS domain S-box-containing protein
MNTMGQGLTIINEKNQYSYANNFFANMMGYKSEELIGVDPFSLTHPDDMEVIKNARKNRLAGKTITYEIRLMHKNGSIVYVMNTTVPLMKESRNVGAIIVVTDLKDRREMEAKIRKNAESMRALYEISSTQETTLAEKVQSLLVLGCQLFEMETGIFSKVQDGIYSIRDVFSVNQSLKPGMDFDLGKTYCQEVLKASGPVAFEHASKSEWIEHPCFKETHMEAFIGTPVTVAGKVYGTLNFSSLHPHKERFTAAEKEFLRLVSQWLGTELEREQYLV